MRISINLTSVVQVLTFTYRACHPDLEWHALYVNDDVLLSVGYVGCRIHLVGFAFVEVACVEDVLHHLVSQRFEYSFVFKFVHVGLEFFKHLLCKDKVLCAVVFVLVCTDTEETCTFKEVIEVVAIESAGLAYEA